MSTEYTIEHLGLLMRRVTRTKTTRVITEYETLYAPDKWALCIQIDRAEFADLGHGLVYGNRLVLPHDGYLSDDELLSLARANALPVGWSPDEGSITYRPE